MDAQAGSAIAGVALQLPAERGKTYVKLLGGQHSAAVVSFEGAKNVLPFDISERPDVFGSDDQRVVVPDFVREIVNVDDLAGRKGACPFDGILKLADIARPGVSQHLVQSIRSVPGDRTLHLTRNSGE